MKIDKEDKIKNSLAISFLLLVTVLVFIIIIKYQVEGEKNMPFALSKITIISTAEGQERIAEEGQEVSRWNLDIYQKNDVYFFIDKNEEYKKTKTIDSVYIENIQITKKPEVGTIKTYMPSSLEGRLFKYNEEFLVEEKLEYKGDGADNYQNLEIGNQGGKILLDFANTGIGSFISNDEQEIKHDGTLLTKANVSNEQIKFEVNFDFIIKVNNVKYKANITLNMPEGNILEDGRSTIEKTDMSDIIFKRI